MLKKAIGIILCVTVLVASLACITVSAEEKKGMINGTDVNIRQEPSTKSASVGKLSNTVVNVIETVSGEKVNDTNGDTWYHISYDTVNGYVYNEFLTLLPQENVATDLVAVGKAYITDTVNMRTAPGTWNNVVCQFSPCMVDYYGTAADKDGDIWYLVKAPNEQTGYVYSRYVKPISIVIDLDFDEAIKQFPKSYREGLKYLHALYPNWKFIPDSVDSTKAQAVAGETGRKLVSNSIDCPTDWKTDIGITTLEPGYSYASAKAIEYYLSPENFFDVNKVFMFLLQSRDEKTDTVDALKSVVKNTFLDTEFYINTITDAAKQLGVNSSVLAGNIIGEQGVNGTSALISGTYTGYEGYYNFFNIGASGESTAQIITSGLSKAKENGWDTPLKSIVGGASYLSNGYLDAGQDTFFYIDFNIKNKIYHHQYATNIGDAEMKARLLSKGFVANSDSILVFKIPVYSDADMGSDTPVTPPVVAGYMKGDVNNDKTIDAVDLAAVKLHILGIRNLTGDAYNAANANGDETVDAVDLAAIKLDILGIRKIN